jgi:hypothetical protein
MEKSVKIVKNNKFNRYYNIGIVLISVILVSCSLNIIVQPIEGSSFKPLANNPPSLASGSVSPSQGTTSTTFTYQVTYTDIDNDPPSLKRVYIDGTPYTMSYVSGNYTSGAIYQYNTKLSVGNHNYYFYFTESNNGSSRLPTSGTYTGPYVNASSGPNNAPVLSQGSVSPSSGTTSTTFTYKVKYTDSDNDPPTIKRVYIDSTPYNMNYISGSYTTGAIYQYKTKLGVGNHNYYFYFTDGKTNGTGRLPSSGTYSGPLVNNSSSSNNAPTLSQGSVSPSVGTTSTTFTYQVKYKDADNDPPFLKRVYIDGTPCTMSYVSGNYTSGAIYQYKTNLGVGNHNYYFYFTDGNNGSARLPTSGTYTGPYVNGSSGPNNAPVLSKGSVSPSSGTTSTTFTYQVKYSDSDNDPPAIKRVYIDGTPYTMNYVSGNYNSGAIYQYKTRLSVGNHTYYFYFTDGNGTARLPINGTFYGPVVTKGSGGSNSPPTLSNGFVSPTSGTTKTSFIYQVTYKDVDGDPPSIKYVYIDSSPFTMWYVSGTYKNGAIYQYNTTLSIGNHTYWFYFQDSKNQTAWIPLNGTYFGPVVTSSGGSSNNAPILSNGYVNPSQGYTTTLFTYQVTYKDTDNDPPTIKYVYINGKAYNMNYVSGNYKNGALYQYKTKLPVGSHNYHFYFKDYSKSIRLPSWNYYFGPIVNRTSTNNPPTLNQGSVSPKTGSTSTIFTYKVQYKDLDNDPPSTQYVYIDGSSYKMSYVSGSYLNGSIYQFKTNLGLGNHTYYFYFSDGLSSARLPIEGVFYDPVVNKRNETNNPPSLSYGSVTPKTGTTSSTFTYQVTYKDLDNDLPTMKKVFIDNVGYTMKYVSGKHISGAIYQLKTKLSLGNHTYSFKFNDGTVFARLPLTGSYDGPVVTNPSSNNPPVLYTGSVYPNSGISTTKFTYMVYYKDKDNDPPTIKNVYIDNKPYTMTYNSGTYTSGAIYIYNTTLVVGYHNYYFYFSDGKASVRLPSSTNSTYPGPNVTAKQNFAPMANAGSDQTAPAGETNNINFDATGSSDPENDDLYYFWNFGDGHYAYGVSTTHSYKNAGIYNVTLTVWDGENVDQDYCLVHIEDSGQTKAKDTTSNRIFTSSNWVFILFILAIVILTLFLVYIYKRKSQRSA